MRKKTKKTATVRVAALLHEDILASSITLPMEILAGAAQALGRGAQQSLPRDLLGVVCAQPTRAWERFR